MRKDERVLAGLLDKGCRVAVGAGRRVAMLLAAMQRCLVVQATGVAAVKASGLRRIECCMLRR